MVNGIVGTVLAGFKDWFSKSKLRKECKAGDHVRKGHSRKNKHGTLFYVKASIVKGRCDSPLVEFPLQRSND